MFATSLAPVAAGKTLSNTVRFGNAMASFLLTGNDTGNALSLTEITMRPGTEPPYHIHDREDEIFYIMEGHLSVMVDGDIHECRAGQTIFLPRGIPHTFRVRSNVAKGLAIVTPSGFEKYFQAIGKPATTLDIPERGVVTPEYFEAAGKAAAQHGIRLAPEQPEF